MATGQRRGQMGGGPAAMPMLDRIRSAAPDAAFDRAYIDAQYENCVFLRGLTTAYLANSSSIPSDMGEMHGHHLATLALATFKEHTMITQRIAKELRAESA